jgi:hypothetical protein
VITAAVVGLGVALSAAALLVAPARSSTVAVRHAVTENGAVVPLVVCPTSFGTPPLKRAAFPSSTTLAVSTALAGSLSAYTDTQGYMTVIAPRRWRCSASYGADGSGGVRVLPKGASVSKKEGIAASETSACFGCTTAQACALFPAAATAYRSAYNLPCPARRPPRESAYRLSKTVVAFEDPPYVKGEGAFSGGPFPANGVMTYVPGNYDGSYIETCTLPDSVHTTCTAILNDFVARYPEGRSR